MTHLHAVRIVIRGAGDAPRILRLELERFAPQFAARDGDDFGGGLVFRPWRSIEIREIVDAATRKLALKNPMP